MPNPQTFDVAEMLRWLTGGGAVVIVAAFLSYLAELYEPFQVLDAGTKRLYMVAGSLLLGIAAWAVLKYVPPEALAVLNEPIAVVMVILSGVLGNQMFHALVNKPLSQWTVSLEELKKDQPK